MSQGRTTPARRLAVYLRLLRPSTTLSLVMFMVPQCMYSTFTTGDDLWCHVQLMMRQLAAVREQFPLCVHRALMAVALAAKACGLEPLFDELYRLTTALVDDFGECGDPGCALVRWRPRNRRSGSAAMATHRGDLHEPGDDWPCPPVRVCSDGDKFRVVPGNIDADNAARLKAWLFRARVSGIVLGVEWF